MTLPPSHLIEHPSPFDPDRIDHPTIHNPDVRQEAALWLFRTLPRTGVTHPMHADDLVTFYAQHPGHVVRSLQQAVGWEVRKQRGQSATPRSFVALGELDTQFIDPTSSEEITAVEDRASATEQLEAFLSSASPAEREAVELLQECQRLIAQGSPLSDSHRSKLKRLRRSTGLALDVSLL